MDVFNRVSSATAGGVVSSLFPGVLEAPRSWMGGGTSGGPGGSQVVQEEAQKGYDSVGSKGGAVGRDGGSGQEHHRGKADQVFGPGGEDQPRTRLLSFRGRRPAALVAEGVAEVTVLIVSYLVEHQGVFLVDLVVDTLVVTLVVVSLAAILVVDTLVAILVVDTLVAILVVDTLGATLVADIPAVFLVVLPAVFLVDVDIQGVLAEEVFLSILVEVHLIVVAGIQELRTRDFRHGWVASWLSKSQ